jgi:hypothetical protein
MSRNIIFVLTYHRHKIRRFYLLNETCSEVHRGKHLCDTFPVLRLQLSSFTENCCGTDSGEETHPLYNALVCCLQDRLRGSWVSQGSYIFQHWKHNRKIQHTNDRHWTRSWVSFIRHTSFPLLNFVRYIVILPPSLIFFSKRFPHQNYVFIPCFLRSKIVFSLKLWKVNLYIWLTVWLFLLKY